MDRHVLQPVNCSGFAEGLSIAAVGRRLAEDSRGHRDLDCEYHAVNYESPLECWLAAYGSFPWLDTSAGSQSRELPFDLKDLLHIVVSNQAMIEQGLQLITAWERAVAQTYRMR